MAAGPLTAPASPVVTNAPDPAPSPVPVPTPVAAFTPNYVSSLAAVRRWDRRVVTVALVPPPPGNSGASPDLTPLVQKAIDLWESKVGQDIQFKIISGVPPSPSAAAAPPADILINWVAPSALPTDSIGRTQVQFRLQDQILLSAQVHIAASLPDNFQVQVIAHELGHALGIDGHSKDATDLMYANTHLPAVVTVSDQNTVRFSYAAGQTKATRAARNESPAGIGYAEYICGPER